jgi:hypothetical protein
MFPVDADIKREVVTRAGVKAEWVSAPMRTRAARFSISTEADT